MLNDIPDTRQSTEISGVFLRSNNIIGGDHVNEIRGLDERIADEPINVDERRIPSGSRQSESMASPEIPRRNSTDDMVTQTNAVRSQNPRLRLLAECIAELFGTAILIVIGCGGAAQYVLSDGHLSSYLSVNFAFGLGAMIAVLVAAPVSGAHINPAVSIAMLSLRSITLLQCLTYIMAQFIGAFVAAGLVFVVYHDAINLLDGGERQVTGSNATAEIFCTLPAPGVSHVSLFFDQVVSTAILLIAVCSLSNRRNKLVANAQIPLTVALIIVAIGVSFGFNCGYPINPARDLGPRLFILCVGYGSEVFSVGNYYFWIPCIGPILGALIGAWLYQGYSKLMEIHIGDDDRAIARARYQIDVQNVTRI